MEFTNEQILAAYREHGSDKAAADALGIAKSNFWARRKRAEKEKPVNKSVLTKEQEKVLQLVHDKGVSSGQLETILAPQQFQRRVVDRGRTSRRFLLGMVSDTHLVDKGCALDELHDFYERAYLRGVKQFIHAGDLATGVRVYPGQEYDLVAQGVTDHLHYCADNYPKIDGTETFWIGGNHDEAYTKRFGFDFGKALEGKRPDLKYLGMYDATIKLNGVRIGLHHGDGGNAYAISYKLQKFIEKIGSGHKPQIYALGHYHGAFSMFYRNIHAFLPGCWQKPNDFSVRHGMPNVIGGYILDIEVLDDEHSTIRSCKSEFVSYYDGAVK